MNLRPAGSQVGQLGPASGQAAKPKRLAVPGRGLGRRWASYRASSRVKLPSMAKRRGKSGSPSPAAGQAEPAELPLACFADCRAEASCGTGEQGHAQAQAKRRSASGSPREAAGGLGRHGHAQAQRRGTNGSSSQAAGKCPSPTFVTSPGFASVEWRI
ncbi:MAG TPA: hypothetical protein VGX78_21095 [Pirellulales bacterium]|jgi:hypothetical protein|nr:hypothetical protein [Pirellulales bacterium]